MADEKPKTFRVKLPLRRDGQDYAIGKRIRLSAEEAAAIGDDVLEPIDKQPEEEK